MEAILFIGIQGSGKSTYYRLQFFDTHVRINLDMLKTRHREGRLLKTCLEIKQRFVVDNTNLTALDRRRYIEPAKASGFRLVGYYFESKVSDCLVRNAARPEAQRIPAKGIWGAAHRLELPQRQEGFDELFYVRIEPDGKYAIEQWKDES